MIANEPDLSKRSARGKAPPSEGDVNRTPRRARWQSDHIGRRAQAVIDADSDVFLHQSLSTPCLNVLQGCEGIYIEDLEGQRYMDFHGNNVHQVGFANPAVIEAIKNQLDLLSFCTRRYTNQVAVDLARKLTQITPGDLGKVLFCPGGASSIGMALKLARLATGRHKTISMWDSFHGASLEAISIGGEATFREGCDLKCADYIEYVLEKERDVAAVIAEPVRSTPYVPRPEYWQAVRRACDRYGALLIFDEIPHALGRTGRMFTCEHFDVVPDILVLGKGLGGGIMPLAAIVARLDLDVAAGRALGHYTHEKNPVACAAALATIDYIETHRLAENARRLGAYALEKMRVMAGRHPLIGDVRGLGLLMGIELVRDRNTRERAVDEAEAVMYSALSMGLSFKTTMGNILTLSPPLIITRDEMDQALLILDRALSEVESQ
jgi:4-aminobutyrate aminotransferase